LFEGLLQSDVTSSTVRTTEATITATKISASDVVQAGGSLVVPVPGRGAEVTVPASVFAALGEPNIVMTVSAFDSSSLAPMSADSSLDGGGGSTGTTRVAAAVNVNFLSLSNGSRLSVNGLSDSIKVALPVNRSEGMQCAYWDEQRLVWATDGLSIEDGALGSPLVCKSSHLTLFGAILRGFVDSLVCSQAGRLNAEAISSLGKGDWHKAPGAVMLWAILATLLGTLALGMLADAGWRRHCKWQDEHFLIPTGNDRDAAIEAKEEVEDRPQQGFAACTCCSVVMCCCTVVSLMKQNSAANDALAEIRHFFQGFWQGLDLHDSSATGLGRHAVFLAHRAMCLLLESSARRQASASMRVSDEVLTFLMGDDRVCDILLARSERRRAMALSREPPAAVEMPKAPTPTSGFQDEVRSSGTGPIAWTQHQGRALTVEREEVLARLHEILSHYIDKHLAKSGTCVRLPKVVWHIFLVQSPFGGVFLHNIFMSCTLRAFLFMLDVVGALMLGTVLFDATGIVTSRSSQARCDSKDPREQIGRLLGVGTSCIVLAGIPVALLHAMHNRSFKTFPYEGCQEWNSQLRTWRDQDKAIWAIGSLYLAFCVFFICVFLANVSLEDSVGWAISGAISIVEGAIVVPLCIATVVPFLTALSLSAVSCINKVDKAELILQRRAKLMESKLMPPIVSV